MNNDLLVQIHEYMVKSRVLEERLIKIYKAGEAYFWIGGAGEEAFGVPLGLLVDKGQGIQKDWLHLHYRCGPTLIAMGLTIMDSIRLMMSRQTDPSTGGRNFSNHYCFPKWNVAPVSSPIEVQYVQALGTAHVQKRYNSNGITIVSGGDAGTAEGDFASCLIWASRKGKELPILITVQNNFWGISTSFHGQHGEENISDRAKAFGMPAKTFNGNDPIESYQVVKEAMDYIRKNKKPYFLEAKVSRLYGHSSASGANRIEGEIDCINEFEQFLYKKNLLTEKKRNEIWEKYELEARQAQEMVRKEPYPTPESIWNNSFANGESTDWRKF